jgi:hypothetical protein
MCSVLNARIVGGGDAGYDHTVMFSLCIGLGCKFATGIIQFFKMIYRVPVLVFKAIDLIWLKNMIGLLSGRQIQIQNLFFFFLLTKKEDLFNEKQVALRQSFG